MTLSEACHSQWFNVLPEKWKRRTNVSNASYNYCTNNEWCDWTEGQREFTETESGGTNRY